MTLEKKRFPGGGHRRLAFTRAGIVLVALVASILVVVVPRGQGARAQSHGPGPTQTGTATSPPVPATLYGSLSGTLLNKPIVGIAATPDGKGYWIVASDGGIFSFGDAHFYGSTGSTVLNKPIVGMAATPDGKGYWLVASDGGIFSFGDGQYYGSTGATGISQLTVGMATGPRVLGYWLVTATGLVSAFAPATTPQVSPGSSTTTPNTTSTTAPTTVPPSQTIPSTIPSTIPTNCSSDVTDALNSYFASLNSGATVSMPANACFLVSSSPASLLMIDGTRGVTIQGNGATFEQTSYNGGICPATTPGANQYIFTIEDDSSLTVNDLNIKGPGDCNGEFAEGDVGIMVSGAAYGPGSNNIIMNGVSVSNVDGDGLDVYPDTGTNSALNSNITFENGSMRNVGYHAVVPEGVNGLTISNNTFDSDGNFMDLEVDNTCGPCYGTNGVPLGIAQWNVTVEGNTFTNFKSNGSGGQWIEEEQSPCVPAKNWLIKNNHLDSTVDVGIDLFGSASTSCALDDGLQIVGNVATAPTSATGSIASPPGEPIWSISDWSNVAVSGNNIVADDGSPAYYPNTPWIAAVGFCGVSTASVSGNVFNNFYMPVLAPACFDVPSASSTGMAECGNTYWLTEPIAPLGDIAPPPGPRSDGTC